MRSLFPLVFRALAVKPYMDPIESCEDRIALGYARLLPTQR